MTLLFLLIAGIGGGTWYYTSVYIPQGKYNQALEYMASAKYDDAIEIFSSIANYRDSNAQIDTCRQLQNEERYQMAVKLKSYKSYDAAIEVFRIIEGYKDSSQQILICQEESNEMRYQNALALISEQNYKDAIEQFRQIEDYKDSSQQILLCQEKEKEARYQNALDLLATENYIGAINAFTNLTGYKDSSSFVELSKEKLYLQAMEQMNNKQFDLAKSSFQFLASYNYSDSSKRIKQCDALSKFLVLYKAIENDTSGYYANVTYKSDPQQAIVALERMYEANSSDEVIKQLYYVAEIVSLVKITENGKDTSAWSKENYPQIKVYARQIDRNYSGPMAEEIIGFANKYVYIPATSSTSSQKVKTYFDLTIEEKSNIIAYIYSRYQYYDTKEGKTTGDKYTNTVMQEAANQFSLLREEISMVWSDQEAITYYNNHKTYTSTTNKPNNTVQYKTVSDSNIKSYLFSISKELISQRLKSPSSAKFPFSYNSDGVTYSEYSKDNNTYYVVSMNVEAQNSFGATVNSTFYLELKKVGAGNDWYVSLVSISER